MVVDTHKNSTMVDITTEQAFDLLKAGAWNQAEFDQWFEACRYKTWSDAYDEGYSDGYDRGCESANQF